MLKISISIKKVNLVLITVVSFLIPFKSFSQQAGILDSTFGNNGVIFIDTNFQFGSYPFLDAQNRIVSLASENDSTLVIIRRYLSGNIDSSFGNDGQLVLQTDSFSISSVQFQNDDKIICAGIIPHSPDTIFNNLEDFCIARFLPDGSIDNAFGNQGRVIIDLGQNESVSDIKMMYDSLIVISGSSGFNIFGFGNTDVTLLRLLPDGNLDSSFANNGVSIIDLTPSGYEHDRSRSFIVRPDNKIVLSAENGPGVNPPGYFALLRYNSDGNLDTTFGSNGIVIDSNSFLENSAMVLDDDLSILAGGGASTGMAGYGYLELNKFTPDGAPDLSFGVNGSYQSAWTTNSRGFSSLVIQSDHKIVATGIWNDSLVLMRLTPQGFSDNTFNSQGMVLHQFGGWSSSGSLVCLIPNDKITILGNTFNQVDSGKTFIASFINDIANSIANEPIVNYHDIKIYPNPATTNLTISFQNHAKDASIFITDITGKLIYKSYNVQSEKLDINTSDFAEGVYLVQIQTEKFIETKKVIVTK